MTSSQAPGSDDTSVVGRRWRRSVSPLPTVSAADQHDLVWDEFVGQFRWFDRSATAARVKYQVLKIMALALGASVTVLAAIGAPAGLTASLAAAVVLAEGVQQVFQFHANWISYRATAETLRQHAFLFAAGVAPYAVPETRRQLLATCLRDLLSNENSAWTKTMREPAGTAASTTTA